MKIVVMPGDGIGIEVTRQAVKVLKAAVPDPGKLDLVEVPVGGAGLEAAGDPLPPDSLKAAQQADAILFGSAGMPGDEQLPYDKRPGASLLRLRKALDLYANFRPATVFPELIGASTLRPEVIEGLDLMILRELSGDAYFGEPRGFRTNEAGERVGFNTISYSESEVRRIAHAGFKAARARRGKLCSVDKANVLESMVLWRDVVTEIGAEYPDVELSHLFVDAAAMMLMRAPTRFDVIVTGNVFGDILSDAAAMLTGSIGMLPSASLGSSGVGLYEPVHGTAPDIAGRDIANPFGSILSAAMMMRYSFDDLQTEARILAAVRKVLADGWRTADLVQPGTRAIGTEAIGDKVVDALRGS